MLIKVEKIMIKDCKYLIFIQNLLENFFAISITLPKYLKSCQTWLKYSSHNLPNFMAKAKASSTLKTQYYRIDGIDMYEIGE